LAHCEIVQNYLNRQKLKRLRWPALSPDLSPIENLWKQIKVLIGKRRHKVRNTGIAMIEIALGKIWPAIEKERLLKLNASMPNRLNLCIKNKGGSLKY
jgi:transposase